MRNHFAGSEKEQYAHKERIAVWLLVVYAFKAFFLRAVVAQNRAPFPSDVLRYVKVYILVIV